MAYAALVSLAQTLDQFLIRHSFVVHDQNQQIQSLHEKIVFLSTFLEDFPREATNLEARITVAANQVEDFFELLILNELNGSEYEKRRCNVLVRSLLALSSPRNSLKKLYKQYLKKVAIKEINSILKEAMKIKIRCTSENQIGSSSSTPALIVQGPVVGFEKDLLEIQERLHGESAKLEVIPIFGMGGIGKTTLARYAFHDPLSLHHFDVSGWVTVSQNYDNSTTLLSLLHSIVASSKLEHSPNESLPLQERVYKYLKGRRFLIVVDDMWNSEPWDDLRRVFPDDFNGSRIIITTRSADVASYVDSSTHSYEMHLMGVESSWNLLRQKVFEDQECPPELQQIGWEITEKCRGLPLAIVVIAGVLSKVNRMRETWRKIAINVKEAINKSKEPFAEILSLSYTWLPHHLRPCFLYMGGFPEDYEIHVSKLVKIWVAEGFLKSNESKDLEEVAEDYIDDLAKRSLVLIIKKRYDGRIKSIKMHDLLRDLCLRKAHDDKFMSVVHKYWVRILPIETRRISFIFSDWNDLPTMDYSSTHTILFSNRSEFVSWKRCRLLRVVDSLNAHLKVPDDTDMLLRLVDSLNGDLKLFDEIGELLHLRYLAFTIDTHATSSKLPDYFSKLVNLQTLNICAPFITKLYLPYGIWRMSELRHVIIRGGFVFNPPRICALQNLLTLKRILDFTCSERIVELIPNIKKLGVFYYDEWWKHNLNNLVHLQKLEKLNIYAHQLAYLRGALSDSLAFPATLKKLKLCNTFIPWEEMSIIGSLPNLQVLKLKWNACEGLKWETIEGQFCQLKVLEIEENGFYYWITETCHFPKLERLTLKHCFKLREIPRCIGDIPTLQLIEVISCISSIEKMAKSIKEEQREFGNELLQLHLGH